MTKVYNLISELSSAIYGRLVTLFSDSKICAGNVVNIPLPYTRFILDTLSNEIETTDAPLQNNVYGGTIQIDCFEKDFSLCCYKLNKIKNSFITDPISLITHKLLDIYLQDFEVIEEDNLSIAGDRIYRAIIIFKVRIIHG